MNRLRGADPSFEPLTRRELEALQLAAMGETSGDIAKRWGFSPCQKNNSNGSSHVRRVWKQAMDKLGADSTTQAVAMALRRGLIN